MARVDTQNDRLGAKGKRMPQSDPAKKRRSKRSPQVPLVEKAYRAIKERILENEYYPGFQALEMDLADEFGMSRTPIREALVHLEKEGLIEIVPRHGMRVLPVSAKDMLEIFQLLAYLEAMAVDLIMEQELQPEAFDPLDATVAAMTDALEKDDVAAWAEADQAFHRELLKLAGSQRLAETIGSFWDQTRRAKQIALYRRSKPTRSTENHRRLVKAMRRGEAKTARDIHFNQRKHSHAELLQIIERFDIRHL